MNVHFRRVNRDVLYALGEWLHLSEPHTHEHSHEALEHKHEHPHDAHHRHVH